jgi:hypothetical protein
VLALLVPLDLLLLNLLCLSLNYQISFSFSLVFHFSPNLFFGDLVKEEMGFVSFYFGFLFFSFLGVFFFFFFFFFFFNELLLESLVIVLLFLVCFKNNDSCTPSVQQSYNTHSQGVGPTVYGAHPL